MSLETTGERSDGPDTSTSPQKTSLKKNLIIASIVVGFIMNVVSLIMAILAWVQINEYTDEFSAMVGTWQTSPITDVDFAVSCPAGYSSLAYGSWNGVYDACNCINKNPNTNSTSDTTSACDNQQIQDGCDDAPGWPSITNIPLFIAGNQKLCYQASGPDTLNRPVMNGDGTCPAGSVVCGNTTNGDFGFCFPGTCPLTDAWIGDVTPAVGSNLTINETAWNLATELGALPPVVSGNLALFYKRGGTLNLTTSSRTKNCPATSPSTAATCNLPVYGFPIISFDLWPAFPCYLGEGSGWAGRGSEYTNMENTFYSDVGGQDYDRGFIQRTKESGCTKQFDTRYVGVYGELERNMYQPFVYTGSPANAPNNQIPSTFLTSDTTSYRWYLTYHHETQWASAASGCPVSRQRVVNNAQDVSRLKAAQAALIALTVLSFIFLGFVGCCVTLAIIQKDNDGKIEKGEDGYKTMCGLKIANYVMKVAMYSCVIASVVLALGLVGLFADITQVNDQGSVCTDSLSLSSFQGLNGILDGLSKKNIIQGFTNFVDFLMELFHQTLHCIF